MEFYVNHANVGSPGSHVAGLAAAAVDYNPFPLLETIVEETPEELSLLDVE